MSIVILGGTFDPIHNGHLYIAKQAMQQLSSDKVFFIPCKIPVHKSNEASASDRLQMLQLALQNFPSFAIDTRELDRDEPSYTILTLQSYRNEFPKEPIYFIIGADSYQSLSTWYQHEKLLDYCHLIVIPRLDTDITHLPTINALSGNYGTIARLQCEPWDCSSTQVREQIATGNLAGCDIPDEVRKYIRVNSLYIAT